MIGKMNGSSKISEEDVVTLEKGGDRGFNQEEVTCDQNLDIFRE